MGNTDLVVARELHAALKQIFMGRCGGRLDKEALQRVMILCRVASAAIDDRVCRHQIGIVSACSGALFPEGEKRKWNPEHMPRAIHLRSTILGALIAFRARIYNMDTVQRMVRLQPHSAPSTTPITSPREALL